VCADGWLGLTVLVPSGRKSTRARDARFSSRAGVSSGRARDAPSPAPRHCEAGSYRGARPTSSSHAPRRLGGWVRITATGCAFRRPAGASAHQTGHLLPDLVMEDRAGLNAPGTPDKGVRPLGFAQLWRSGKSLRPRRATATIGSHLARAASKGADPTARASRAPPSTRHRVNAIGSSVPGTWRRGTIRLPVRARST
jgi:hypothetical protein